MNRYKNDGYVLPIQVSNQQPRPKGTKYASEKTFFISRQASGNQTLNEGFK